MTDNPVTITSVTSQYATQVAQDLKLNTKEQERIGAELSALQAQLRILQDDQSVLHSIQKTLGSRPAAAPSTPEPSTSLPQQASGKNTTTRRAPSKTAAKAPSTKKTTAQAKKEKTQDAEPKAATASASASASASAQPTLIALIRTHLDQQTAPRSAAEVTSALAQTHPQRTIKSTVVRTTLENLVAKSQAHRSKQGASVLYTSVAMQTATEKTPAPALPQTEQDNSKHEKAGAVSS
ncbi:hypothetical protein [Streptomyces sp. CB01635]|uniref:hypothetical protein n=1 Tax=Streptomyces sp. CB01635 TaxID=2020326 RepID=UPI0018FEFCF0|nr:hypothetical protein [Streptomyces sp. CB01635]